MIQLVVASMLATTCYYHLLLLYYYTTDGEDGDDDDGDDDDDEPFWVSRIAPNPVIARVDNPLASHTGQPTQPAGDHG